MSISIHAEKIPNHLKLVQLIRLFREARLMLLAEYFSRIAPYLAESEEGFKACRSTAGLRLFFVAQFNEFQDWLLNPLDGIADATPELASTK